MMGTAIYRAPAFLGLVPTGPRSTKPIPAHLLALVPKPQGKNETIKSVGADPLRDTVPLIKRLARRQMWQGKKLAQALKGATVEETLRNDWNFIFNHIQYVPDPPGRETVRSLRRLVSDGRGDCDCFVNALGNLLLNQKIPFILRVTKYDGKPDWQHIYIKAGAFTLDPVVHQFNYEVPYTAKKDFTMTLESFDGFGSLGYMGACPPKVANNQVVATTTAQPASQQTKMEFVGTAQLKAEGLQSVKELLMEEGFQYKAVQGGYEVETPAGGRFVPNIIAFAEGPALINELKNPTVAVPTEPAKEIVAQSWATAAKWTGGLLLTGFVLNALFTPKKQALNGLGKKTTRKQIAIAHI